MKDELELMKTMFGPVPESFSGAVQRGLESPGAPRRTHWRTVLVAAALILLASSAFAVTRALGLLSAFDRNGSKYPSTLQAAIVTTQPQTITAGPLSFTLVESLSDPYQTYAACTIQRTSGEDCLITWYDEVAIDYGANAILQQLTEQECIRLHLPEDTTYAQAAKKAGIPVYVVNAQLTRNDGAWSMPLTPDIIKYDDGSALLIAHQVLNIPEDGPLDMTLTITVYTLNPETGRPEHHLTASGEMQLRTVPVSVTAVRTYLPEKNYVIGPAELLSVKAEQTACGVYFTITSRSNAQKKASPVPPAYMLCLVDSDHRRLPTGISNAWRVWAPDWPLVYSWHPTALDALPEEIIVTDFDKKTGMFVRLHPEP